MCTKFLKACNYKLSNHILSSLSLNQHAKIMLAHPIVFEKWLIYESCNLIGQEHFQTCKSKKMLTISHPLQLLNLSECQKSSWFIIFEVQLIQELCGLTGPKHFCPHLTKICKTPFMFLESISHVKNQIASWFRYSWLKNPAIWLEERIFNLKFKKHRLRFLNLYLHVKNQVH